MYYTPLHVSSTVVLIIGRSKLYYTASGIITPIGGRPVHRLKDKKILKLCYKERDRMFGCLHPGAVLDVLEKITVSCLIRGFLFFFFFST